MIKEYIVEGSIKEWMLDNAEEIFVNVLEACEKNLGTSEFVIMKIRTITGVTLFKVSNKTSVANALHKCEKFFVRVEDYEKAARCRDCSKLWESL